MDESAQYGDFSGDLNPLAMVLLLVGALVILAAKRQNGLKAFLGVALLVPMGQQFIVLGLHFMFFRVVIAVGLVRVLFRGEFRGLQSNKVDKLFIGWAIISVICGAVRGFRAQQIGGAYDALGAYFLVRIMTKEPEDVLGPLRFLGLLSLFVAAVMCLEAVTHHNPFGVMGGVPMVDAMRNGRARAQGPFQNNLTAGIFGATLFPLMVGLWMRGGDDRRAAIKGLIGCIIITITSVSSGAVLTFIAACIGLYLWRMRDRMRFLRRWAVVVLIALDIVMKVPVWWLISKASNWVGGSGWYRSWIIDVCVQHFHDWWLVGDSFTHRWSPNMYTSVGNTDNLDITNYYVSQCITGGIWLFVVFILILAFCFQIVGRLVHSRENLVWERHFIWTFGVCLAAYCTTFVSMNVSGQSGLFWHWFLAVVVSLPALAVATDMAGVSVVDASSGDLAEPALDDETGQLPSPNSP